MKKEIEKFKEGDFIRAVETIGILRAGKVYSVNYCDDQYVYLGNDMVGGWFFRRFKKINKSDMTEEEKFNYIKHKLGVK